ncbi:hypothetical protein FOCC_FOCC012978 [Frankliniella occidentalis]|uniref:Uncharacterized protein LOC113215833 n=1 Tax=Frankliniella occidentalis TaxID=133901 RepID=A0A6J1STG9_FRAOC|nr:uncharacterized protein LOC113215833 [Frankliniella occidentalis]KAE8741493.1 hypothetical protein FOCC_FOCC012978 [Frankliniella occidentalis]
MAGNQEHWTDDELKLLVRVRIKHDSLFCGSNGNIAKGWKTVIQELASLGLTREHDRKIKRKFLDESKKFKDFMNPSLHTGRSTEDGESISELDPELFELFANYFEGKHTLNPPALYDSSMPSTSKDRDHSYATSESEYLGPVPSEYVEVGEDGINNENDDEDDETKVTVTAHNSKRCKDFYQKNNKKQKGEKKKNDEDWFKEYLVQSREDRKEEMNQLLGALKNLAPPK